MDIWFCFSKYAVLEQLTIGSPFPAKLLKAIIPSARFIFRNFYNWFGGALSVEERSL